MLRFNQVFETCATKLQLCKMEAGDLTKCYSEMLVEDRQDQVNLELKITKRIT